jgi:hypothetical protein
MYNPAKPILADAVYFDKAFAEIGDKLSTDLTWLTNNYGRAEYIPELDDLGKVYGKTIYFPAVYVGDPKKPTEYLSMMPDEHLDNHVFFLLEDVQEINPRLGTIGNMKSEFSIIFWWDYRKVYVDHLVRSVENVKKDILTVLLKAAFKTCTLDIKFSYVDNKNVYLNFEADQVNRKYLMRPYGGLKLSGTIKLNTTC